MAKQKADNEDLMTIPEAANYLDLYVKTVYKRNGGPEDLLRVKIGRSVRLLRSEICPRRRQVTDEARD